MIDHAGSTAGNARGYHAAFALLAVLPLATWFWVRHTEELPPVICRRRHYPALVGSCSTSQRFAPSSS